MSSVSKIVKHVICAYANKGVQFLLHSKQTPLRLCIWTD